MPIKWDEMFSEGSALSNLEHESSWCLVLCVCELPKQFKNKIVGRQKNPLYNFAFYSLIHCRWVYSNNQVAGPVQNITYTKHILIEFC